jgi:hypothetical protein
MNRLLENADKPPFSRREKRPPAIINYNLLPTVIKIIYHESFKFGLRTLKPEQIEKLIPVLSDDGFKKDGTLRAMIGLHDPINIKEGADTVLEFMKLTLKVAISIRNVAEKEKGSATGAIKDFTECLLKVQNLNTSKKCSFVRYFTVESLLILEKTVIGCAGKLKNLRRKNVNKLPQNVKELLVGLLELSEKLKALD